MKIGEIVTYCGRAVIVLGLEPMSVPDRLVHVRDLESGAELRVPLADLLDDGGLAPVA